MEDFKLFDKGRFRLSLAWYDIWIGAFVDSIKKKVYICPLPGVLITVRYQKSLNSGSVSDVTQQLTYTEAAKKEERIFNSSILLKNVKR